MKQKIWSYVLTLFVAGPLIADDEAPAIGELRSDPEIVGAIAAIDAWIEGRQIYDRIPGVSVGIVSDQDMLWSAGYGYANIAGEVPADDDTLYSICSISKLFTAIGIMQLRDESKLRLRDSVNEHLEWFNIAQAHDGSLGMAHAYIDAIASTGAGAVKFKTHIAAAESTPVEPWRVKFSQQNATRTKAKASTSTTPNLS